jgi:hypothetical protein
MEQLDKDSISLTLEEYEKHFVPNLPLEMLNGDSRPEDSYETSSNNPKEEEDTSQDPP